LDRNGTDRLAQSRTRLLRIVKLASNAADTLLTMLFSPCEFMFVFLPLALAGYFGLRARTGNPVMLFLLTGTALTFYTEGLVLAKQSETSPTDNTISSSILDAINQNTPGQSEGYAVGVPNTFAWCSGSYKPRVTNVPPSDFTAVTGWGAVYPKVGAPKYSTPEGSIIVANAKTYVHLRTTGEWILVQDQATDEITGAHFPSDFSRKASIQMQLDAQRDGSLAIGLPPAGYNDHFWIVKRGTYAAGSVDAVYVQMDMRTTDPNVKLVANVGADWWRDPTVGYVRSFANNPGVGMSNWIELSTQWSTLRFYSWSTSKLMTEPPPPLADTTSEANPSITRRTASTPPPCLSRSYDRVP
jgi:hypothetical protein